MREQGKKIGKNSERKKHERKANRNENGTRMSTG